MKWCSVRLAAVMFVGCVAVWAAIINFGQFVDDAAAVWAASAAVSGYQLMCLYFFCCCCCCIGCCDCMKCCTG